MRGPNVKTVSEDSTAFSGTRFTTQSSADEDSGIFNNRSGGFDETRSLSDTSEHSDDSIFESDDEDAVNNTFVTSCNSDDEDEDRTEHNTSFVSSSSSHVNVKKYDATHWEDISHRLASNDDTLVELEIGLAALPRQVATDIAHHLSTNFRLKKLSLNLRAPQNFKVDPVLLQDFTASLETILQQGLLPNTSIVHLHIQRCTLDPQMASLWARALAQRRLTRKPLLPSYSKVITTTSPTLQSICLDKCLFVESGLAVFLLGLQHHAPTLVSLKIRNCDLSHHCHSDVLAAGLPLFPKLQYLTLTQTQLSARGFPFLCDHLAHCPTLCHLHLSRNSNIDIEALTPIVTNNPNLQTLDLEACDLDDHQIEQLVQGLVMIPANHRLTTLQLSHNPFDKVQPLKTLLQSCPQIKSLHVQHWSVRRQKPLHDVLRYNNSVLSKWGVLSLHTGLAILETKDMMEEAADNASRWTSCGELEVVAITPQNSPENSKK